MIQVKLNGEIKTLADSCSLEEALKQWGYAQGPYAVAVNARVIHRKDYQATRLVKNAIVDVISPMQGG